MNGDRDEALAEPAGSTWLGSPRRRRAAGALVVALGAVLVVLRLTSTGGGHPDAAPSATFSAAPVPPTIGPSPVDVTPGRPHFEDRDPAHCPAPITCRSGTGVPPGVLAAIRRYVPDAELFNQTNVVQVHPDRLYFRQVLASAKDIQVLILVARADRITDPPTEAAADPPGQSVRYVRLDTGDGFVVQVEFTGPPQPTRGLGPLRALAVDARLRALD
jgi:hypothetical protein